MTWEEINAAISEKVKAAKDAVKTDGLSEDEKRRAVNEALASELKNMPHEVRQFLHDGGHQQATAQNAQKLRETGEATKALETEKADLEKQVADAKAKIKELEASTPDATKIRETLQADFKKREEELQNEATKAKERVAELEGARKTDKVDGFVNRFLGHAGSRVTGDGEEWLRVRVQNMRNDGRFQPKIVSEEGKESRIGVAVLRPGSSELEYHAANDDELLSVLTEEVFKDAPKWAVKANVSGGGGAANGSAGGGVNKWDKVRETAKSRHATTDTESVNSRRDKLLPQD